VDIDSAVERVSSKVVYGGKIATVRVDEFRHADGLTSEREVVGHPGAVAMLAHDGVNLYLVRQPREAVCADALLELPAGKLDVPGESAIDCARRELAEEIGKAAASWRELKRFYTTPGFADEEVTVFLATDLSDSEVEPDPEERIEIVAWPLEDLDGAIVECADAKSLVGMLIFKELRRSGDA
jgi:8-oxo-dGTP pyrophosphatase MutT (NUDIX family)